MSVWSKVEGLCWNVRYDKASFPALIDSKKYGYFSEAAHKVSGYYEEKFLLIVLELFKVKHQTNKSIFHALHIDLATLKTSRKVFKSYTSTNERVLDVVASIDYHIALEKDFPGAVAKAPYLLGKRRIDRVLVCVDTMEELYKSTLSRNHVIKGKISVENALQGLFNIAQALEGLHKKNIAHRDLKNWNIFVADGKLLIFDFDLSAKFPRVANVHHNYEFWDSLTNRLGFIHPFCDVFGWTVTLATVIWGKQFHNHFKCYRYDPHSFHDLAQLPHDRVKAVFYEKAVAFIKSVFERDREAYISSAAYFEAELAKKTSQQDIYSELFKRTQAVLPKMQDCIEFLRPWVNKP